MVIKEAAGTLSPPPPICFFLWSPAAYTISLIPAVLSHGFLSFLVLLDHRFLLRTHLSGFHKLTLPSQPLSNKGFLVLPCLRPHRTRLLGTLSLCFLWKFSFIVVVWFSWGFAVFGGVGINKFIIRNNKIDEKTKYFIWFGLWFTFTNKVQRVTLSFYWIICLQYIWSLFIGINFFIVLKHTTRRMKPTLLTLWQRQKKNIGLHVRENVEE